MTLATPGLYPAGHPSGAGGTLAVAPRTHERSFPARPDQVGEARRFLAAIVAGAPVAEDAVLCLSELASNCVIHSVSGQCGGSFTVRVQVRDGESVWIEVADEGGRWRDPGHHDRLHGLGIVGELAAELGIAGSEATGWVVWARLNWPGAGQLAGAGWRGWQRAGPQPRAASPSSALAMMTCWIWLVPS
jgi:serine/threonine-protein kinase RsbW